MTAITHTIHILITFEKIANHAKYKKFLTEF